MINLDLREARAAAAELRERELQAEIRSSLENPQTPLSFPAEWLLDIFNGGRTDSGIRVSEMTALQVSTVLACVSIIAKGVASLPFHVYERQVEDKRVSHRVAVEHPLHDVLRLSTNPEMTSTIFRATVQAHMLLWGNGYAEIQRDNAAQPIALWPRNPARTRPVRITGPLVVEGTKYPAGTMMYTTNEEMGDEMSAFDDAQTRLGPERIVLAEDMLHFRGLSLDGRLGQSTVYLARQIIGLALATEKYGAKFFGNGAVPRGILQIPGTLEAKAIENLRRSWQEAHGGENTHKTAVLESGVEYKAIGIDPQQSQLLETRKYQRSEIAVFFQVPPHMVGEAEKAKSNVEQTSIEFLTYCLQPWLTVWEQETETKLFRRKSLIASPKYFLPKFDTMRLLYPDASSRSTFYRTGKQNGYLTTNDCREREGLNPATDGSGDIFWAPVNMVNAATGLMVGAKPGQEEPAAPAEQKEEPVTPGRSLAQTYLKPYTPLFRDAFGRLANTKKRSEAHFQKALTPILSMVADEFARARDEAAGIEEEDRELFECQPFVKDYISKLAEHSPMLSKETVDAFTAAQAPRMLGAMEELVEGRFNPNHGTQPRHPGGQFKDVKSYAMRHAHTAENDDGRYRSWLPNDIDEKGREQCRLAAAWLADKGIKRVICGDLPRLKSTMNEVLSWFAANGIEAPKIEYDWRLNSWNIGMFVGKKISENSDKLDWYIQHPDEPIPGGEALNSFKRRVKEVQGEIRRDNPAKGPTLQITNRSNIAATAGDSFSGYKASSMGVAPSGVVEIDGDVVKIVFGDTEPVGSIIS